MVRLSAAIPTPVSGGLGNRCFSWRLPLASAAGATAAEPQSAAREGRNMALGARYTLFPNPNYARCTDPDDKIQLTDGKSTTRYFWTQKGTVGWQGKPYVLITVDLGRVQPIQGVAFTTAAGRAGVLWPASIEILLSDDGKAFYDAGDLVALDHKVHGPWPKDYAIRRLATTELHGKGRYVRFLASPAAPDIFCDEVEVFEGPAELLQAAHAGEPIVDIGKFYRQGRVRTLVQNRWQADVALLRQAIDDAGAVAANSAEVAAASTRCKRNWNMRNLRSTRTSARSRPSAPSMRGCSRFRPIYGKLLGVSRFRLGRESLGPARSVCCAAQGAGRAAGSPRHAGRIPRGGFQSGQRHAAAAIGVVLVRRTSRRPHARLCDPPRGSLDRFLGRPSRRRSTAGTSTEPERLGGASAAGPGPPGLAHDPSHGPAGRRLSGPGWHSPAPGSWYVAAAALAGLAHGISQDAHAVAGRLVLHQRPRQYGITAENREPLLKHLQEHFVNCPWAGASVMMHCKFASHDPTQVELDTREFDDWIAQWPHAAQYRVFLSVGSSLGGAKMGTAMFDQRVAAWISAWVRYLAGKAVAPERLALLVHDEPHEKSDTAPLVAWARAIHAAESRVVIWEDPTYRDLSKLPPKVCEVSTVLCPNRPMWLAGGKQFEEFYRRQQAAGRALEFYSCSGPARALDPYSYYRLQAWHCWQIGAVGSSFWAFADNSGASSWNEYLVNVGPFTPLFLDQRTVTAGKAMEAIRESVEDYETLAMLQKAVGRARGGAASRQCATPRRSGVPNRCSPPPQATCSRRPAPTSCCGKSPRTAAAPTRCG